MCLSLNSKKSHIEFLQSTAHESLRTRQFRKPNLFRSTAVFFWTHLPPSLWTAMNMRMRRATSSVYLEHDLVKQLLKKTAFRRRATPQLIFQSCSQFTGSSYILVIARLKLFVAGKHCDLATVSFLLSPLKIICQGQS